MPQENFTFTKFIYKNKSLIFYTPNNICVNRVKTLLTKEPCTIKWLEDLKPTDILWDVGSNIGIYSIFAAIMQGCNVISFEPESQNYAIQSRTIMVNKLDGLIKSYCVSLGNANKLTSLGLSNTDMGSSGHSIKRQSSAFSQGTTVFEADKVVELGIPKPTHIKIDVDGLDHEVIEGATRLLDTTKSVLIELDLTNKSQMNVIKTLEQRGFYYDPKQVEMTARPKGDRFEHFREFIFNRY